MRKLPKSRSTDILTQDVGKELLIYDLTINKAYSLNETLAAIYQACDGITTFDELKANYFFTDDAIFLAIDELKRTDLLENSKDIPLNFAGLSRREAIKRVGIASMMAIPLIIGLSVPTAAQTASGLCVGAGRTLNGNLITSIGSIYCEASPDCGRLANGPTADACCSGRAEPVPNAPECADQGTDNTACRCLVS